MRKHHQNRITWGLPLLLTAICTVLPACQAMSALPPLASTKVNPSAQGAQTAVFAGGCFWGVEGVFEHIKGVRSVSAGYTGGAASTATYDQVSTGDTGHAESVQVIFDPAQVNYAELMRVYFSVATDPTELNRQGPDRGTQYRSALFVTNAQQRQQANAYIAQLSSAHAFPRPIVTQVTPFTVFYPAERHHQQYLDTHPYAPYIVINDAPKVAALRKEFPELYTEKSSAMP